MPKIVSLKDNNSIIKYPATISDAVIDLGTGKKLSDIIDSLFDYLYFEAVLDSNISFTKASGLTIDLKYKIDNGKWLNYSSLITLAAGHKAYFKGDNEKISESGKLSKFIITGGVNVGGNIMSLLGFRSLPGKNSFSCLFDYCTGILSTENLKLPATTLAQNCYEGMFRGCSSLTTPPQLPATTLASYCYYYMFMGCTSLTTPPQLPATTLVSGCYYQMFINCTSLIKAPELSAITLALDCYGSMFLGCTSLVEIPSILPATTLVLSCYLSMFSGCTSLTTTPSLPATTLALFCYDSMFYGCTSLVEVPPILPATTLALGCYGLMFYGCTSLEKAPELPAPTLVGDCYGMMFYECSKLNYIKALFTTSPTTQTYDWVNGVAPSGTFIKSSEATWNVNGNNGVPANWVIYKSLPTSNQSKIYTNVLRKDASYSSPYSKSYFYFGQLKLIDLLRPSYIKYRVIAYTPGNGNFMLDSMVEWDFGYNGIYKSYYIYNNLSSTSYYPFGYHTLYRSNSAAITLSDGSYFGFYFGSSNSYGQSASTIARTIEVEILECYNCEATLIDSPICLTDAADVPANFRLTSTSVAYNTTNFTAVNVSTGAGLQETGDANSDTVGYSIRTNSYSKPMKSALGYGYRLLFTSSDLLGWVPANNSASSNATAVRTPATDPIDPFGEIVYYSGTAAVAANSRPSATTLWELYTVGLGYSFNTTGAALTLTSWKPIYIRCTPLANGSAILQGYTLDLPTEEDGFIYIYLGVAYNATAFELVINHPVYYYNSGAIRLWTNQEEHLSLTSEEIDRDIIEIVEFKDPIFKLTLILRWDKEIPSINGEFPKVALDTLTTIPSGFMSGSNITSIEDLENFTSLTSLNSGEFNGCQYLTSVTIPDNIQSIGNGVFAGSSVSSVTFGSNLEVINNTAFNLCLSLTTLSFPSSLKTLDSGAFASCTNLTSVTLNEGLLTIGSGTFCNTGITSIAIPSTVTDIYTLALSTSTVIVDFGNTRTSIIPYYSPWGSTVPNLTAIIVPDNLVNDWKSTVGWSSIASYIVGYSEYYNN